LDFLILLLDLHTTKRTLEKFKKNLEQEVQNNPDREVFFFDESRFGTHSRLGHGWFKTGIRTPVTKKLGFNNFYLYTAACQRTGENFTLSIPHVNAVCFNVFLSKMEEWLNGREITS